jgi:hypothetical protein
MDRAFFRSFKVRVSPDPALDASRIAGNRGQSMGNMGNMGNS